MEASEITFLYLSLCTYMSLSASLSAYSHPISVRLKKTNIEERVCE
jgi:hypothetical protein